MARIRVVLDACVLVPYQLADLLLRIADAELFEPLWSEEILAEVERSVIRLGVPAERAQRRIRQMRAAFPNAVVDDYQALIPVMRTDPKDRHVAAAAVRGAAALIVTANVRDFPPEALQGYDIEVVHPDEFLRDQLDLSETVVVECLRGQRDAYTRPSFTSTEFYLGLANTVPTFAAMAAMAEQRHLGWTAGGPLPVEIISFDEMVYAFFPEGAPAPTDARGAAFLWWAALLNRSDPIALGTLSDLTLHPSAWGDFESAEQLLSGHGLMQNIEKCPGDDQILYAKFIPNVDHPVRAFGEALVGDGKILTLVRCADGWWRVWGLSTSHFPPASQVRGT